jgi:hypothetical protein
VVLLHSEIQKVLVDQIRILETMSPVGACAACGGCGVLVGPPLPAHPSFNERLLVVSTGHFQTEYSEQSRACMCAVQCTGLNLVVALPCACLPL